MQAQLQSTIENAYISLELNNEGLDAIRTRIQDSLHREGLNAECPTRSAHVSLGYALGAAAEDILSQITEMIAGRHIELKVCGVELLEGLTTPFDYVALKLEESQEFREAKETVERRLETKRFPGGFKVHVTLLQAPKGTLQSECCGSLRRCLEEATAPFCERTKVTCDRVAVFDNERRCRIERPLSCLLSANSL